MSISAVSYTVFEDCCRWNQCWSKCPASQQADRFQAVTKERRASYVSDTAIVQRVCRLYVKVAADDDRAAAQRPPTDRQRTHHTPPDCPVGRCQVGWIVHQHLSRNRTGTRKQTRTFIESRRTKARPPWLRNSTLSERLSGNIGRAIQGHSRSPILVPIGSQICDFLLVINI